MFVQFRLSSKNAPLKRENSGTERSHYLLVLLSWRTATAGALSQLHCYTLIQYLNKIVLKLRLTVYSLEND